MSAEFSSRSDVEAAHALASGRVFDRTLRAACDLEVMLHSLAGTLAYEALLACPSNARADQADALAKALRKIAGTLDSLGRDVRPAQISAAA